MQNEITQRAADKLRHLVEMIPSLLRSIPEEKFSYKPLPEKWSKKQIIGHLVDSASNNHHRLIRARYEDEPLITYDQVQWNRLSNYNEMDSHALISFWTLYNGFMAKLIEEMPAPMLDKKCKTGSEETHTIGFIIEDYITHLEHHLRQVVKYP